MLSCKLFVKSLPRELIDVNRIKAVNQDHLGAIRFATKCRMQASRTHGAYSDK